MPSLRLNVSFDQFKASERFGSAWMGGHVGLNGGLGGLKGGGGAHGWLLVESDGAVSVNGESHGRRAIFVADEVGAGFTDECGTVGNVREVFRSDLKHELGVGAQGREDGSWRCTFALVAPEGIEADFMDRNAVRDLAIERIGDALRG